MTHCGFGGWGENFNDLHNLKNQFYTHGGSDWCEEELNNLIKQRREFEKGFKNQIIYGKESYYISLDGKIRSLEIDEINDTLKELNKGRKDEEE